MQDRAKTKGGRWHIGSKKSTVVWMQEGIRQQTYQFKVIYNCEFVKLACLFKRQIWDHQSCPSK
jgi:hypothetical protein